MYMRERFKECLVINEKKNIYISNNYKVNPGSFMSLVFTVNRGMADECMLLIQDKSHYNQLNMESNRK